MNKALASVALLFSMNVFAAASHLDPIPGKWYAVYSCDNGAMVVDKALTGVSGSHRSYSTQLVIRNQEIVNWFVSNNAVYSQLSYNEAIYGNLATRSDTEFFHSDEFLTQTVKIYENSDNISIHVKVSGSGSADWLFRHCQKTADFNLFQN